jgi:hypothetical protein
VAGEYANQVFTSQIAPPAILILAPPAILIFTKRKKKSTCNTPQDYNIYNIYSGNSIIGRVKKHCRLSRIGQ